MLMVWVLLGLVLFYTFLFAVLAGTVNSDRELDDAEQMAALKEYSARKRVKRKRPKVV